MIHNRPVPHISLAQRFFDIIPVASLISAVVHLIRFILSKHSSNHVPRPLQDRDVRDLSHKQWGLGTRALLAAIPIIGNAILLGYEMKQCCKKKPQEAPVQDINQPLHEQIQQLKDELEQKNEALIREQEISEVARKTLQDLQQRVVDYDAEKQNLAQNVQILNENNQKFKDQLGALEQEKEDLNQRIEELSEKNQALTDNEEEVDAELKMLKEQQALAAKKIEDLEKNNDDYFFKNSDLINQVEELSEQKESQEKIAKVYLKKIKSLNDKLKEANTALNSKDEENNHLKESVQNLSQQLQEFEKLKNKIVDLENDQQKLQQLESDLQDAKTELQGLHSKNQELKAETEAQESGFLIKLKQAQEEIENLKQKYEALDGDYLNLKEENHQLIALKNELQSKIDSTAQEMQLVLAIQETSKIKLDSSWHVVQDEQKDERNNLIARYTKANIETYIVHVLEAGRLGLDALHRKFVQKFGYRNDFIKEFDTIKLNFDAYVKEKQDQVAKALGLTDQNIEDPIHSKDSIINEGKELAKASEKDMINQIDGIIQDILNREDLSPEHKNFFATLPPTKQLYSESFFENVVHNNHWWHKKYEQTIHFSNKHGEAKVELEAVGKPYSSAAPRNRKDLKDLRVPNFFKTSYNPKSTDEMSAIKMDNAMRSAIAVEFDQKDPNLRKELNKQIVKNILEQHAIEYLRSIPDDKKNQKPVKIDFAGITLLSPSALLDWSWYFGKISSADNEALLFREAQEAFNAWDKQVLVVDGVEVEFQVTYLNVACNDLFFKSADYIPFSYSKETAANQLGINKIEEKLKQYKARLDQDLALHPNPSLEIKQRIKKHETMTKLLRDVKEMMAIPENKKLKAFGNNYYALTSRVLLLTSLLYDRIHFGCRSGKDRTGLANIELDKLLQIIHYLGDVPSYKTEASDNEEFKDILVELYKLSGNIDIIPEASLGCPLGMNIGACANPNADNKAKEFALAAAKIFSRPGSSLH